MGVRCEQLSQNKSGIFAGIAAVGSTAANQLGGWDAAMVLLIAVIAVDYISGLMVATFWQNSNKSKNGGLSSKAGFRGICKKGVILFVVWIGVLLDAATGATCVRTAIVLFYIGNEGISIIENLGLMGVPYPPAIEKALEALTEKGEKES